MFWTNVILGSLFACIMFPAIIMLWVLTFDVIRNTDTGQAITRWFARRNSKSCNCSKSKD